MLLAVVTDDVFTVKVVAPAGTCTVPDVLDPQTAGDAVLEHFFESPEGNKPFDKGDKLALTVDGMLVL